MQLYNYIKLIFKDHPSLLIHLLHFLPLNHILIPITSQPISSPMILILKYPPILPPPFPNPDSIRLSRHLHRRVSPIYSLQLQVFVNVSRFESWVLELQLEGLGLLEDNFFVVSPVLPLLTPPIPPQTNLQQLTNLSNSNTPSIFDLGILTTISVGLSTHVIHSQLSQVIFPHMISFFYAMNMSQKGYLCKRLLRIRLRFRGWVDGLWRLVLEVSRFYLCGCIYCYCFYLDLYCQCYCYCQFSSSIRKDQQYAQYTQTNTNISLRISPSISARYRQVLQSYQFSKLGKSALFSDYEVSITLFGLFLCLFLWRNGWMDTKFSFLQFIYY